MAVVAALRACFLCLAVLNVLRAAAFRFETEAASKSTEIERSSAWQVSASGLGPDSVGLDDDCDIEQCKAICQRRDMECENKYFEQPGLMVCSTRPDSDRLAACAAVTQKSARWHLNIVCADKMPGSPGGKVMNQLLASADAENAEVSLFAAEDPRYPGKLVSYYEKFGFRGDGAGAGWMVRKAKDGKSKGPGAWEFFGNFVKSLCLGPPPG
eukprot:TRINITY_DN81480_c0_g1_i1.p1 TRINITY_DN81480_c0_g1~~TRINITY_DN81480_c0_g1_i1.p1  ORF type:complete len:243 (+),score=38.57 TRINITY_DN81480_c0_g1_i1:94-729(+)